MPVYTFYFDGHYPVGACGIVVAPNELIAKTLARNQVGMLGLNPYTVKNIQQLDTTKEGAKILLDGDY